MIRDVPGVMIVQPPDSERVLWNEPTQNDLRENNVLGQSVPTESLLTSSNSRFCCHCCSCLVFLVLFLMMGSHICSSGQPWLPCVAQYDTNWSSCLLFPCTGIASTLPHPAAVDSLIFYPLVAPIPHFHGIFFCLSNTISFGCPQAINTEIIEMQSHLT